MINHYLKTLILDTNARYFGISILDLMERAGRGVAEFITKKFGKNKKIAIFCGLGNNGGDGMVAARYLVAHSDVTVFLVGNEKEIKTKEARENWKKLKVQSEKLKVAVKSLKLIVKSDVREIAEIIAKAKFDIVIDALFGVGFTGRLREPYIGVIKLVNKIKAKKVAVDVPSPGFKADYTVSMHYPKVPGAYVADIGLGKVEYKIGPGEVKALYKPPFSSHKGQNGQLMIIAGSERYHGAPLLAAKMASKIVDLVFFSSVSENNELVKKMRSKLCEFIVVPREEVEAFIKRCDAILIGPGMGMSEETKELTNRLLKKYLNKKFVLDADALKLVDLKLLSLRAKQSNPALVRDRHTRPMSIGLARDDSQCVLTPHAGEFQTLFKIKATPENVAKMTKKYKCVIVLKGAVDVVCGNECYTLKGELHNPLPFLKGELERDFGVQTSACNFICKKDYAGNAVLTKGGTGDVLAGLIAALGCKNDLFLAACAGTFLLGKSGERLFKKFSYYYNPSDLILEIPKTIKWCEDY